MTCDVKNRVIVITGASRGLGRACAQHFAENGAALGLLSRDEDALTNLHNQLPANTLPISCDITDICQLSDAIQRVNKKFGQIDSVLANAGGQSTAKLAAHLPIDKWQKMVDLNLTGAYLTARTTYDYLRKSKAGRFVFISSAAAHFPLTHMCAYAASKAGVEGLARALSVEWSEDAICVNAIAPGLIDTPGSHQISEKIRKKFINKTAFGRPGETLDIANAALFLLSDASNYITGQTWAIDGGYGLAG